MASLKDLIVMGPARFLDKLYGNLEGNATSTDKLKTARTINGTSFDGTTNITTTNWGTTRNIYIQDSDGSNTGAAVSVNGGANATLKLPATIKASLNGNASTANYALKMQTYKQGSTTETYGTSYPLYSQWESANVLKLKCDNNIVKTDTATYLSYPAQLTTDDAINAFNATNTFQVTTWNGTSSPGITNGIIVNAGWASATYGAQIAIDDDPTYYIALRQRDTSGWKAWKRIPMGDGTGASGTWGISITGNAATATKIGTATIGSSTKPIYLNAGTPTAFSTTVGNSLTPVYMNAGTITQGETFCNRVYDYNNARIYYYSFGGGQDKNWKKIFAASHSSATPTSADYRGCTVKGTIYYFTGNFDQAEVLEYPFQVNMTFYAGTSVVNSCILRVAAGCPDTIIRVVRVTTNSFELQVRQPADWKKIAIQFSYSGSATTQQAFSPVDATNTSVIAFSRLTTSRYISDSNNGADITITYAKDGQSSTSWFASWNGYELGSISTTNARNAMSAMAAINANGYYGMGTPSGGTSDWIRTTTNGIIPYQSGGSSSLGTSSWPFSNAYINTVYGNLSGNASTATNADKLDNKHANEFIYFSYDTGLGNGSPADTAKSYFTDDEKTPRGMIKGYYNHNGAEYSQLYSRALSGSYGSILKWGYSDRYIRILRYYANSWKSEDWEKIDAGNADTATKLATARTISLTGSVTGSGSFDGSGNLTINTTTNHTHSYLPLSGGTMNGTAFITWPDSGNWSNSNSGITFPVKRGGLQWVGQSDSIQIFSEETSNDNLNLICQFADDGSPSLIFRTTDGSQVARIGADGTMSATTFYGSLSGNAATSSKVIDSVNGNPITITYAKAGQSSTSWFASWNGYELGSISTTNARNAMSAMGLVWANDFYGMAQPDGNTSVWIRTPLHGIIPYQTGGASSLGANGWSFNSAYINTVYGSLSGNASTATQLATARSINGTNFDGTVNITTANWGTARNLTIGNTTRSVNGSTDISWPNPLKIAYYGSDSANTNGWYKVGTWSQSGWSDMNLNLLVTSGYGRRAMGIIYLAVRCDNNTTNYCTALKWLCRYGFNIGDFYFKDHGNNTWSLYVQQTVSQYGRVQIQVLSETGTSASQHNLTFNSNDTKESAAPTGGTVSTDGNFIYSSTEPSGRYEGMVWLKPIS